MQISASSISMPYSSPPDCLSRKANCMSTRTTSNYLSNCVTLSMAKIPFRSTPQFAMKSRSPSKTQRTQHQQLQKHTEKPGSNGLSLRRTNSGAKNSELESPLGLSAANLTVVEVYGVKMGWAFLNFASPYLWLFGAAHSVLHSLTITKKCGLP